MPYVILGDDAFSLSRYLLKPFPRSANLNAKQIVFNYRLSRARRIIGRIQGRSAAEIFRKPICLNIDSIDKVVLATCVLHNFLKQTTPENPNIFENEGQPSNIRNIEHQGSNNYSILARSIREEFADYFYNEGQASAEPSKRLRRSTLPGSRYPRDVGAVPRAPIRPSSVKYVSMGAFQEPQRLRLLSERIVPNAKTHNAQSQRLAILLSQEILRSPPSKRLRHAHRYGFSGHNLDSGNAGTFQYIEPNKELEDLLSVSGFMYSHQDQAAHDVVMDAIDVPTIHTTTNEGQLSYQNSPQKQAADDSGTDTVHQLSHLERALCYATELFPLLQAFGEFRSVQTLQFVKFQFPRTPRDVRGPHIRYRAIQVTSYERNVERHRSTHRHSTRTNTNSVSSSVSTRHSPLAGEQKKKSPTGYKLQYNLFCDGTARRRIGAARRMEPSVRQWRRKGSGLGNVPGDDAVGSMTASLLLSLSFSRQNLLRRLRFVLARLGCHSPTVPVGFVRYRP
ncbi:hypothetical protein NQ318_009146 [Aromia moschata]|uniref:DDE Tnp4 domain-containing protein n=1 Tax=Aromia moschata TaxID=1265417 RepID=A0AAV8XG47_9CUCU|nr:hypothetical protein NQ318_009146 [Aromia moschata]